MSHVTDLVQATSDMGSDKLQVIEDILFRVKFTSGIYLEVGTRMGGTALLTLSVIDPKSLLISVDPYGSRKYEDNDTDTSESFTDEMYVGTLMTLSKFCVQNSKSFQQYKMTSIDFLGGDFAVFDRGSSILAKDLTFDYVLLDGDHRVETVRKELELLEGRVNPGGILIVDNADWNDKEIKYAELGFGYPRYDMAVKVF